MPLRIQPTQMAISTHTIAEKLLKIIGRTSIGAYELYNSNGKLEVQSVYILTAFQSANR